MTPITRRIRDSVPGTIARLIWVFLALMSLTIAGCATTKSKPERASVGMTRQELRDKLGDPRLMMPNGSAGSEKWIYRYNEKQPNGMFNEHDYWVILQDGKVTQVERSDDAELAH